MWHSKVLTKQKEIGYPKPYIEGLRKKKLIRIVKPINSQND
jgi:hypothetical protein